MKKSHKLLLCVLSGILLSFGWYEWGTGLSLFIAFIPLLFVEEFISLEQNPDKKRSSAFLYGSLTFLVWNAIDTWWIKNASFAGMLAAFVLTTFLMAVPFWLYSVTKRTWGRKIGYISLIIYWLAMEFSYMHGEISWPWLTLGYGFMFDIKLIQWYEYTGVFGGSLWVLIVNLLLFEFLRKKYIDNQQATKYRLIFIAFTLILMPIVFSIIRYHGYKENNAPQEIVVVQPNIDPYMKFNDIPPLEQTQIQIDEAAKAITSATDYVVCPETSVMDNIWIGRFDEVPDIHRIQNFVKLNPRLKYITGIMCYKAYGPGEHTPTSHELGNSGIYYDSFNSAIQIDTTKNIPIYHKSMLVTGVEKMPYPQYFRFLKKLMLNLGGTFRSHGIQKERDVFHSEDDKVRVGPVICWESVFGEFVGGYINKGANIIFVITNDGWWGNTPGHRQHNAISCIRAIETRRSIARSANTGISSFINQRGDVLQRITWEKRGAIRETLNTNNKVTFYSIHGDYIARSAFYLAGVFLLILLAHKIAVRIKR